MLETEFLKELESPFWVTLDIPAGNRAEDTEAYWAGGSPKMELIKPHS